MLPPDWQYSRGLRETKQEVVTLGLDEVVETMVHDLVTVRCVAHELSSVYRICTPVRHRSQSKLLQLRRGQRVSDNGIAHREVEAIEADDLAALEMPQDLSQSFAIKAALGSPWAESSGALRPPLSLLVGATIQPTK